MSSELHDKSKPSSTSGNSGNTGEHLVSALNHIINTSKVEHMNFEDNPVDYISFMHNFETCLKGENNARDLQFLIQHCKGKTREAIESCVNLPVSEGYETAKRTLKENFGLLHIIASAHIRRIENLPPVKYMYGGGLALLEFARSSEVADRDLKDMGAEYESELNHVNILRELNRKLLMFLKVKMDGASR